MSGLTREEQESFRADGLSAARCRDFRASERACREADRARPISIEGILAWIDQLRAAFGEPPVDRTPWRGDDFRI